MTAPTPREAVLGERLWSLLSDPQYAAKLDRDACIRIVRALAATPAEEERGPSVEYWRCPACDRAQGGHEEGCRYAATPAEDEEGRT